MSDEPRKRQPSNFAVLLVEQKADGEASTTATYRELAAGFKDSQAARSWLKKHLEHLLKEYGLDTEFRMANLSPVIVATTKTVTRLTI